MDYFAVLAPIVVVRGPSFGAWERERGIEISNVFELLDEAIEFALQAEGSLPESAGVPGAKSRTEGQLWISEHHAGPLKAASVGPNNDDSGTPPDHQNFAQSGPSRPL
jgi:hypothetical protein